MVEQYPDLEESLKTFLTKTIKNTVRSQSIAKVFKVKEYPGSRYEEIVDGNPVLVEMKPYDTKFLLKGEHIKKLDLISIRREIYEGCRQTAQELDKDLIRMIEQSATTIDVKDTPVIDSFLKLITDMKRRGEEPVVITHPDVAKKLYEEALKPENQEKLRKYRVEFGYEPETTK